jgi:hypothetical protein
MKGIRPNRVLRDLLLFLGLNALIIAVTWPWAKIFATGFIRHWDPPFHAWKLNLVAESLLKGHLFPPDRTTNIFFPSSLTLYYEALHWPQAVLAALLRVFTDNLVLVYHLVLVLFWAFSGVCFSWLLRELGARPAGVFLGAALFTIVPYRTSYLLEFNMQLCAGLVLFLLFLFRFLRSPGFGNALGASLAFWFQAASELYQAMILLVVLPLLVAPSLPAFPWRELRRKALLAGVVLAALAGGGLTLYFLWPYKVLHDAEGFARSLGEMNTHFVEPLSYLRGFAARTFLPAVTRIRQDEMSVYPTVAVLLGALLYALSARRVLRRAPGAPGPEHLVFVAARWVRVAALLLFAALAVALASSKPFGDQAWTGTAANLCLFLALAATVALAFADGGRDAAARARAGLAGAAVLGFILALGPRIAATNTGWRDDNWVFLAVYERLSLLSGMRVVSRFSVMVTIFLVVAAVAGWEALCRRWPRARWTAILVLAAVFLEARVGARPVLPFSAPWHSPAIDALDRAPDGTLLILPMADRSWDSQYMLGIAGSERKLLYGWGGFYPPFQEELARSFGTDDFDRGIALVREVWPETSILLDRKHLAPFVSRYRKESHWGLLEGRLAAACETVAVDDRFTLYRVRQNPQPVTSYQRVTRRDVLLGNPIVRFSVRAADGAATTVGVAVNDTLLGTLAVSGEPRTFVIEVPRAALVDVYPNRIRIGSLGGGAVVVDAFSLAPRGGGEATTALAPWTAGVPWPSWLRHLREAPAGVVRADVRFRNGVEVLGYSLSARQVRAGDTVDVAYFLAFDPGMTFLETPALHTHALAGERIAFQDLFPATVGVDRGSVRSQPYRKIFRVDRRLAVPPDAAPGRYGLRIALTDEDGKKLPGSSAAAGKGEWFRLSDGLEVLPRGGT